MKHTWLLAPSMMGSFKEELGARMLQVDLPLLDFSCRLSSYVGCKCTAPASAPDVLGTNTRDLLSSRCARTRLERDLGEP